MNDIKRVNGHYIIGLHHNGPDTYIATSSSPAAFSAPKLFFTHEGASDRYIVSVGLVVDSTGTKLLGALYGAGAVPTLDHNRIFAKWMQKRVVFMSDDGECSGRQNLQWARTRRFCGPFQGRTSSTQGASMCTI